LSFPRYPSCKVSGVEWLGKIPEHWGVGQSRRLFALRNERAREDDKQLTASQEHGVIYQEDFVRLEGRRVVEVIKGADILKHVEPNDFVISMRSFQGGIEWCKLRGSISSAYVMLVPCERIHGPFFAYVLKSRSYIQALQTTSNLVRDGQALRYENFTKVDLPLVPMEEQTTIAEFLDRETEKIDELVAEQRRLMELLKEKRQAVISHAVTRGLSPAEPLKPSGIDWLGAVPAHWRVLPMRLVANVVRGASPRPAGDPKYFGGEDVPWVTVAEITKDNAIYLTETESFLTHEGAMHSNLFRSGTLIYSNSGATLGVPKILGIDACANDGVVAFLNLSAEVRHEFLYHYLSSITDYIREKVKQGSGQPNLNTDIVKDLRFGVPPLDEQEAIVQRITELTGKFDALTDEAQRAIELLQERRTALISAAVTGQIDVRAA
jgi:type I restriction enzyme, S subunit